MSDLTGRLVSLRPESKYYGKSGHMKGLGIVISHPEGRNPPLGVMWCEGCKSKFDAYYEDQDLYVSDVFMTPETFYAKAISGELSIKKKTNEPDISMPYLNYKGNLGYRTVHPLSIGYQKDNQYHGKDWIITAKDCVKNESRDFSIEGLIKGVIMATMRECELEVNETGADIIYQQIIEKCGENKCSE